MADLPTFASPAIRLPSIIETQHGKAATTIRPDLEHELRILRNPVRLGVADGEHERHLRVPGRQARPDPDPMAGGAADRPDRAAHRGPSERSHVGPARAAKALFSGRRNPELAGTGA